MSKNNKVEIAEFLTNNEPQIVAMAEASPDIAKAWSNVVKVLAERYGNIVVNTPEPTNEPVADFTECKIDVINDQISEIVQLKLFELGYDGLLNTNRRIKKGIRVIFITVDKNLMVRNEYSDLYEVYPTYKIISFSDLGVSLKDLSGGALVRTKIDLIDEETSIKVQNILFEKGFIWPNTGKNAVSGIRYLFLEENMELSFSNFSSTFEEDYPDWGVITPQDLGVVSNQPSHITAPNNSLNTKDLKGTKMYVGDIELMKKVQKKLFKLGYEWEYQGKKLNRVEEIYLFVSKQGKITTSDVKRGFDLSQFREITPQDLGIIITPEIISIDADLRNTKMKIASKEEMIAVQKELFKRGYKWTLEGSVLSYLNDSFLYVTETGKLGSGKYKETFDDQTTMTEITPEQLGVNINKPFNSHTLPLNEKQFNEMTQQELLDKKQEIIDAMNLFDEEDVEYETLKIQLETLEVFLD